MSYQILPNIIFILAILGILVIILRRLPEAAVQAGKTENSQAAALKLQDKGLPTRAISKVRTLLKLWAKKIWRFALEAKDLKPHALAGYRIRKMFGPRYLEQKPALTAAASTEEVKSEQYFLNIIKRDPKNLASYDNLGKYYLETGATQDALDIYDYLTQHDAANADYQARLAYCYYQLKDFDKTAEHYQKSLALDSSQPNRYYNLGLVLEALGQSEEALLNISRAIALEPQSARYYLSFGNICLKLGKNDEAMNALQKAHELEPQNGRVAEKLERLREK